MNNPLYAGFDLGTTFFKVGIYNETGERVGLGRRSLAKDVDSRGRCTVPVERFLKTVSDAFSDALAAAGCQSGDITGVSYCSQANTFLFLDKDNNPLTPLIVWPDQRAKPMRNTISEMIATERFLESSGQGIAAAESMLAKLDWFKFHEPALWHRAARILTISDYLTLLMTGCFIGDSGTASLTGLWDLKKNMWNEEVLGFLDLDQRRLPELYRPGSCMVGVGSNGAEWLGIPENTPFVIGALDHHTAAIGGGIGLFAPVSVSFGTSLVCFSFTHRYRPAKQTCIGPATESDRYYQIAFNAPGASAMDWYRNHFARDLSFEELIRQARIVKPGCEGLRAEIENNGISFQNRCSVHGHGHCARAVMELTGRNTAMLLNDLPHGKDAPVTRIIAVGGAARSDTWMRIVEETAGVRVIAARPADTASKGAAMFSAVATGQYANLAECASLWNRAGMVELQE
ncbi:MAG: FGGY family carbohydrate kinase [Kiritimatiellae bacterium]|jgi:xylulokinase|nr:FGGY family carbohydrate kinase [Kiritimatiellia bacterium]